MNEITIINKSTLLGREINIYGTPDEPMFLAKDVAEWIEHTQPSKMVDNIDEDEKLIGTIFLSGQKREAWLVTEDGLYEILMQSRKPIAKQFKKGVKEILKTIRHTVEATSPPTATRPTTRYSQKPSSSHKRRLKTATRSS